LQSARAPVPIINDRVFFTTDDGVTLFADSLLLKPPFDHDGRQAVRAYVFKADGPQWVQYLEKYSDAGKRQSDVYQSSPPGTVPPPSDSEWLVKRPGDRDWVPLTASEAANIIEPRSPDGGDAASIQEVNP
jgi:hypothetical protein